jgi:FkbM family methyltransferase
MSLFLKAAKLGSALHSKRGRRALMHGVVPAMEHSRILKSKPWRTIVDIGANKGQFALAATTIRPSAVVHSFEPLSAPSREFARIFAGVSCVHLHRYAIGASNYSATMNVSARDDSSSLLPISEVQTHIFPGTGAVGTEPVQVRTLSEVLRSEDLTPPALLKLDVQGYEYNALLGCEQLLTRFSAIYVECSLIELYKGQRMLSDIDTWLHQRGYCVSDIGDLTRDASGTVVQGDFLFQMLS